MTMNDDVNSKLDWMYKGANSLVNREEYLLGKSVDKSLEQLNAEEKEKKLGIVPPKNHVEHECIPPSIRDFNKIVQAEQVDISAKLQEDPLVAIKKREEEARRQFLQNPVQLKKLQEALKAQELKKKKGKHKKSKDSSDSDIDSKIAKKLKYLRADPSSIPVLKKKKKKSKDNALDTILMHKFNELKDRLSQEDLNDILEGNVSDSDDDERDRKENKSRRQRRSSSRERYVKKSSRKRKESSDTSSDGEKPRQSRKERISSESYNRDKRGDRKTTNEAYYKSKRRKQTRSSEDTSEDEDRERESRYNKKKISDRTNRGDARFTKSNLREDEANKEGKKVVADSDLENKILEKLRILRESSKSKRMPSSSDSSDGNSSERTDSRNHRNDSDSDERVPEPRTFGLVKADGTKIALNKKTQEVKKSDQLHKAETVAKPERKKVKKLTEEEKEKIRKEMMKNAEKRDKERSENLRKYREEDKREEKSAADFDKEFMHKQLVRSTKEATVESRIKSNLNNIQRSSRHMDTHFSRR
ncbi:pre-mRNA-splicing factor CWC25 homolog [Anoplophora glabripennis]|uniref:pre-mRNA-splicing factor CWC25 homolog n=1 Tax=Anoplophora glabripennis TaxID=217634 RepID=UPI000873B6CA|nr:pre-mRNA-splicing factor CWC25 homolog [Anoplophora glabripennis]